MFLTISLAIVDIRSKSFDAAQQGEIITGRQAGSTLPVTSLGCLVERSGTENIIFHTL